MQQHVARLGMTLARDIAPFEQRATSAGAHPEHRGVRRIQETFRELEERRFVEIVDCGTGLPSRILLLSEKGDGSPFLPAPDAYNLLMHRKNVSEEILRRHRYFRVPSTLWTQGHITQLRGPGLAMLLALLSERRGQTDPGVWFSPGWATERFGFAASTRSQGLDQLRDLGLVRTSVRTVSENGTYIDFARRRNVHEIIGLSSPAPSSPSDPFEEAEPLTPPRPPARKKRADGGGGETAVPPSAPARPATGGTIGA